MVDLNGGVGKRHREPASSTYCPPPLEAAPSRLPSTRTAEVLHLLLPSFARLPVRDTIMPSFIVATVQPVRCSALGLPISQPQFTSLPELSSFTLIQNRTCGLVHSTFVTTPDRLTCLVRSNSASNE